MNSAERPSGTVELVIGGMTCAACAARVQRRLNQLPGVSATVNLVTERATLAPVALGVEGHGSAPDAATLAAGGVDVVVAIAAVESIGYQAHQLSSGRTSLDGAQADEAGRGSGVTDALAPAGPGLEARAVIAVVVGVPVIAVSMFSGLRFDHWPLVVAAPALLVSLWCGWPIHRRTLAGARHRATSMDTLISLGVAAALALSLWRLSAADSASVAAPEMSGMSGMGAGSNPAHVYFEVAVAVIVFALVGRLLEDRAKGKASAAVRGLLAMVPERAVIVESGDGGGHIERSVAVADVQVGDRLVVRPGERFATDGVVEAGSASIDVALLTGESLPVVVGPSDTVAGGAVNLDGWLTVRSTARGADSTVARIARLVAEAQAGKAPIQRVADRVSAVFVPAVIGLSLATLVIGLLAGRAVDPAVSAALAVLVVACPCALGLATPVALVAGTGRAARLGFLVRGIEVLEASRKVDVVIFDKTGTVTTGVFTVKEETADGVDLARARALAGALEAGSLHPIGRALYAHANTQASTNASGDPNAAGTAATGLETGISDFTDVAGWGVRATVAGSAVALGRPDGVEPGSPLADAVARGARVGLSTVALYLDDRPVAVFAVGDTERSEARDVVTSLTAMGISSRLLTGDQRATATAVACRLGIDDVTADVRPHDKVVALEQARAQGAVVAMVGDGVNDAAALAAADVGIAMAGGTDVAAEAADITLLRPDLRLVPQAIELAAATMRVIKGNLFWAFAYNVVMIPFAISGSLDPMWAGAAMAASSLIVVLNSLRLLRVGVTLH